MMSAIRVPFFVPWITDDDKKSIIEALDSRWLTGGPRTAQFEKAFAEYVGVRHAVACSSGTAALHIAMRALGIGPLDEVIVPVMTFAATANAPLFVGAKPVFAEVDERTLNMSTQEVQCLVTSKTKAIVPVHYAGQPCDMREIMEIAEDHELRVVEDCAHSLGATYAGRQTGSIGTVACFSFYPTKNITTLEGGMLTTNDDEVARRGRLLVGHCMTRTASERESMNSWFYDVIDVGYNYRLNDVQAALGISQLRRIEEGKQRRLDAARLYDNRLHNVRGIRLPQVAVDRTHAFHLYVVRVVEDEFGLGRDELFRRLSSEGIGLSVHYTPLHLLSVYKELLGYTAGAFPVAERAHKEVISLPLFPTITEEQIDYVVRNIRLAHQEPSVKHRRTKY